MTQHSTSWPVHWSLPAGAEGDPAFARLHQFWLGKCRRDETGHGLLPARNDIDVLDIPRELLRDIALLEVVPQSDGSRRYRIRLFGSALAAMTGADETGRYYDETVPPAGYAVLRQHLDQAVSEARPMFFASPSAAPGRGFLYFGRFGLPLASDGRQVDMILALVRPLPSPDPRPDLGPDPG
ncbi:PAS domain-containing protein [Ferrovibrio terrae]|uniref:PAS domain-containing protein n=1 Tax=Ferrovibrio terrae TaxID=2594003 RepID=A0A516GZI5_9PROT|nr:PAS domain-containing protein [Ferrovibrio terrae]QDO96944.1 PAS domain-containing protein [Ferrovibrio terrae]